jgi:regulator of protease activity HflC (stomatin/prohibitin superfamily)
MTEKELRQIRSTAYRRVQEIQGKADADATLIYGKAYNRNPEFYAFLRTLESYKEKTASYRPGPMISSNPYVARSSQAKISQYNLGRYYQ